MQEGQEVEASCPGVLSISDFLETNLGIPFRQRSGSREIVLGSIHRMVPSVSDKPKDQGATVALNCRMPSSNSADPRDSIL